MKTRILSFIKRIFVLFFCIVLLLSNVFVSYSMTVYAAEDDYNLKDALQDICLIVLGISGVLCPPAELTALGFVAILSGALGAVDGAINIYDHVTDNGDGTYTISPEFVQAVMDASQQLEDQGFSGFNTNLTQNGRYRVSISAKTAPSANGDYNIWKTYANTISVEKTCLVICSNSTSEIYSYCCLDNSDLSVRLTLQKGYVSSIYDDRYWDETIGSISSNQALSVAANIPIFGSMEAYQNAVKSGNYRSALNYREKPVFRRHSSYTPTYSGGSVIVNRTVIENITQKITEVDADDSLTDDQKIEKLQEYIRTGGTGDTGGGGGTGGGSGNTDYDDNKDLPAGADLTDTNSWLKKIYLKVCQIFDKISETTTGAVDTVNTKLQETLDEILSTLRTISGDINDIKGQLENMSEQEFNEKSDSFLGEIMDAFSEISEVVKTKFPFSIPNDLRIFLSKIAPAAPETEEQQIESYSLDSSSGMTLYFGEHGGGGTSDGETNPPGGGGASRPGSGFVDVDHGGGGGSRDPVEMREAPVFRLPIVIERYGIEEYIIIDMAPFDPLSRFSRSFFTIIFMVCLFNLTFKVIGMWGDIVD